MPVIIAVALAGPIFLIIGLVDKGKDAGSFVLIGSIITAIEVIIAICAWVSHKKQKQNPQPDDQTYSSYRSSPSYSNYKPSYNADVGTNLMNQTIAMVKEPLPGQKKTDDKPASVIKRGVAGTVIGGVPGAIIGVASAIDKNNRMKKEDQ